jgi:phosphotransferase system  glucose/maltose/N-acetylglucosamine-specific IIC component
MKERIIAGYSLFLGIAILGLWGAILVNGEIPEGPVEFSFHLISEILMAAGCMAAGILMLRHNSTGTLLGIASHAMVIYSVLNAAGYYAERGQIYFPILFMMLLAASVAILTLLVKQKLIS